MAEHERGAGQSPEIRNDRWLTPEAQRLLRRYSDLMQSAGLYETFNTIIRESAELFDHENEVSQSWLQLQFAGPELPLAVFKGAQMFDEVKREFYGAELLLMRVNPRTGENLREPFIWVCQVERGFITASDDLNFSDEQVQLVARMAQDQEALGVLDD